MQKDWGYPRDLPDPGLIGFERSVREGDVLSGPGRNNGRKKTRRYDVDCEGKKT